MKSKLLLIISCSVILCSCFSCMINDTPQVIFDEEKFEAQKEKWKSLDLKNYTFDYAFGNASNPFRVRGTVTVQDGNSVVELINEKKERTEIDSSNNYYLKDIDAAFDLIYNNYTNALEKCKINQSKIWFDIDYDSVYGFPRNAANGEFFLNKEYDDSPSAGRSSGDLGLSIYNFTFPTQEKTPQTN